jgi:Capsule assembly protein Wzi/PAP2 superfamily
MRHFKTVCVVLVVATYAWPQQTDSISQSDHDVVPSLWNVQDRTASPSYDLPPGSDPQNQLLWPFVRHIAEDQRHFWTWPTRAKKSDLKWLVPAVGATAGLFASDKWISQQIPDKPNQINRSLNISDYGLYSLIGAGGGAYIFGALSHNDHLRETGLLSAEAAINATGVAYALKLATERQRPYSGTGEEFGEGEFFTHKPGSSYLSFPSEHSTIAWSIASVAAHEYPGPLTKFAAYGLATAISLTRVTARQHFASDVIIGAALGWYFGHEVYGAHHDPELGGEAWGNFFESNDEEPSQRNPKNMSSPYVPSDSWVYPMFDRLAALGLIKTGYAGIRPWTRMECARLVEEAQDEMRAQESEAGEGPQAVRELQQEFNDELARLEGAANVGASLDSVYARATEISGTPLRDGYHFAQTLVDDYGRPYSAGFNSISGFSAHADAGPLSFALRAEYQHSPAIPAYSTTVQQAIANADSTLPVPGGRQQIDRVDLLDSTIALQFNNFQISAGKQSGWWSMTQAGPLLLGDNAEPMVAIKLDNVSPYHLPLLSRIFGDARSEYFLGRLDGHQYEFDGSSNQLLGPGGIRPQPFIQGAKLSFRPTENFEFGAGFTAMFAGPGLPFTLRNWLRTFYSHTASDVHNPGKRATEFDFSYRVPGLRRWLTIYRDSLAVDEYTPLTSSRPSMDIGMYMPMLPKIHKLDFRAELIGTPHTREFAPGFVYFDFRRFRDGYTNDGNLLASWIGRAGRGGQGWFTYWISPRSTVQVGYRYQKVDRDFLQGGHLDDFNISPQFMLTHDLAFSGMVQYEHWYFPLLSTTSHSDTTAQLELTFFPHLRLRK